MTWEERMGARKIASQRREEEELYRRNEAEWPKEKAEEFAATQCQDCVEIRQEFGRWRVFSICPAKCPHEHHKNDGPGMA